MNLIKGLIGFICLILFVLTGRDEKLGHED